VKLGGPVKVSSNSDALSEAIRKLAVRQDLSAEETEAAFTVVMEGHASDVQKSALLMGLRAKGETPHEVAGGVRALRKAMIVVNVPDPCGTGGGSLTTFNISTAAAFALAGAGVPVAKHGNRSFSSRCGSADVLEALGIQLPLTPQRMQRIFEQVGLSFLFAPRLHPAMKHLGPVRKELAVFTIMNILGPLTNPARARRQVVGVSDPGLLTLVAESLQELGHIRALVVHGEPGMDELSPLGPTHVVSVEKGGLEEFVFDPARELSWSGLSASEIAGGDPGYNARVIEQVLAGSGARAARAAVVLNAAAGFYVAGLAETLADGVAMAESALDEKKGLEALERTREVTRTEAE
jgi:anthranilate phosphoribosyltransferase